MSCSSSKMFRAAKSLREEDEHGVSHTVGCLCHTSTSDFVPMQDTFVCQVLEPSSGLKRDASQLRLGICAPPQRLVDRAVGTKFEDNCRSTVEAGNVNASVVSHNMRVVQTLKDCQLRVEFRNITARHLFQGNLDASPLSSVDSAEGARSNPFAELNFPFQTLGMRVPFSYEATASRLRIDWRRRRVYVGARGIGLLVS
jgi:hypothetical protein